ncbi:hypothetical protein [Spongiivirga citrea]|uniref:Fibronectin type-III domain-containing protein n=1 Tax=Spongiivirga citrea TaxID=1481457 RepID=A0A6M0CKY6_9FLAO|nr:hypothetical protein [Spongiivirga citrea]NER18615.1 hypothetical protein [Spongiivirga citrea]
MKYAYIFGLMSLVFLSVACNKPSNGEVFANEFFAAKLEYPVDIIPCGDLTFEEEHTTLRFTWEELNDQVDYYNVFLTNNSTFETAIFLTMTNSLEIEVSANSSYSWYVSTFFDNNPLHKISPVSNFMIESSSYSVHPPNAAMPNTPRRGEHIASNMVNLSWICTDRDEDIVNYEVILDTKFPPTETIGLTQDNELTYTVDPDTIYYWMINTEDSQGNITSSEVFQFRTNEVSLN